MAEGKNYLYRVRPDGQGYLAERLVGERRVPLQDKNFASAMLACCFCSDLEGAEVRAPATVPEQTTPGVGKGLARLLAQRAAHTQT